MPNPRCQTKKSNPSVSPSRLKSPLRLPAPGYASYAPNIDAAADDTAKRCAALIELQQTRAALPQHRIAGVHGGAAEEQRVGGRGAAVIGQRAEERIGARNAYGGFVISLWDTKSYQFVISVWDTKNEALLPYLQG